MESLKNKSILIGKEPGQGRLEIVVTGGLKPLIGFIGNPGSVPNTVSRCKPAEGMAHAKIEIDGNGTMTLVNMKPQNITWVNGGEIESKRITPDASVALGAEQYAINLSAILNSAKQLVKLSQGTPAPSKPQAPEKPKAVYNIKHLEIVWNRYHDGLKEIETKKNKVNLIRTGCGMFTVLTVPLSLAIGPVAYVFTGIGFIGNLYSFIGLKNDNTSEHKERLTDEFQEHYCCPNPDCNKFLGNYSYKMLKKQYSMRCPHCKSEFIEK